MLGCRPCAGPSPGRGPSLAMGEGRHTDFHTLESTLVRARLARFSGTFGVTTHTRNSIHKCTHLIEGSTTVSANQCHAVCTSAVGSGELCAFDPQPRVGAHQRFSKAPTAHLLISPPSPSPQPRSCWKQAAEAAKGAVRSRERGRWAARRPVPTRASRPASGRWEVWCQKGCRPVQRRRLEPGPQKGVAAS